MRAEDVKPGMRVRWIRKGDSYGNEGTIVTNSVCEAFNPRWLADGYYGHFGQNRNRLVYSGYQQCDFVRVWWDVFDIPCEGFLDNMEPIPGQHVGPHRLQIAMYVEEADEAKL